MLTMGRITPAPSPARKPTRTDAAMVSDLIDASALLWRVESTTDNSRGGGFAEWRADRKARKALARAAKAKAKAKGRDTAEPAVSA
mgnify:CR=1 FL=1